MATAGKQHPRTVHDDELVVFSLSAGSELLARVCRHLGRAPARHEEREFEEGEHKIRPLQSVLGRDVYIVQSLHADENTSVDDKLCRVLFFVAALRDAGARRLTAVVPYLCYSRKDRRTKPHDPVITRYVAQLFEAVGLDRVATVDVHNEAAYENAFRIPAEHLSAMPLFVDWFAANLGDRPAVVVSPDAGGVKRADRFRRALEHRLARPIGAAFLEKIRNDDAITGGTVVGDVEHRVAIVIDDLISTGSTLARAAAACRQRGATTVFAAATHGVFVGEASRTFAASDFERILIVDTLPPTRLDPAVLASKFVVLDAAPMLADAIARLHADDSLVDLVEP